MIIFAKNISIIYNNNLIITITYDRYSGNKL